MRSIVVALLFAWSAMAAVPYRFLLVVGTQWEDETSILIDRSGEF